MSNLLELQHIGKKYGEDVILSDISFELARGSAIAIVGHSGGGKTTLLSIMGLLQNATSGKVLVGGAEIGNLDPNELAKLRGQYFGFVFQRARLIHSLTALENVLAPAWFTKKDKKVEQQARNLLERFGLEHRLHYKPQALSLGQLRRVSLARALLSEPSIILADEPTNDLDPVLAEEIAECLLAARAEGSGVVIVTHDLELAKKADQTFRLENGRLQLIGYRE